MVLRFNVLSKPWLADYTLSYAVFSLLTAVRLTSLWIVLETWVLRGGFRGPLQAASEELFSFCLLSRAQRQAWSGGSTSLLRTDSCRDSPGGGACSPKPAPERVFPRASWLRWPVASGASPSFLLTGWLISWSWSLASFRKQGNIWGVWIRRT